MLLDLDEPHETQAHAFMVLDGAYGQGSRSGRRHKGFGRLPLTSKPASPPDGDGSPPSGIPAPTLVNLRGNLRLEIVAPIPDGRIYAISPKGKRLWRYDYARGRAKTFASEVVAADLNRDAGASWSSGPTAWRPTRAASSCSPRRARSSMTCGSATRARTATGSASAPPNVNGGAGREGFGRTSSHSASSRRSTSTFVGPEPTVVARRASAGAGIDKTRPNP